MDNSTKNTKYERIDADIKTSGEAKYIGDTIEVGQLYAACVTSNVAHGKIISIDVDKAKASRGVRKIIVGSDIKILTGSTIVDKPIIAFEKVRYFGEFVAIVVADTEEQAQNAKNLIQVTYEELPVVNSAKSAVKNSTVLVHENLSSYKVLEKVYPIPDSNIANVTKIRKGDIRRGFMESDCIIEEEFHLPQSDHIAMETRECSVEIKNDGTVIVESCTQGSFNVQNMLSVNLGIDAKKIIVKTPLVGGAYGGKTPVQLEFIAYIASKSVGGRKVVLRNSREDDIVSSPVHIGLDAKIKLGCSYDGKIKAAEITYYFDGGAYADRAAIISKAGACDCSGPYKIDNIYCDSYCVYTNHPYATAFRGYSHLETTFVMERALNIMADKLGIDKYEIRHKNAIKVGDTSPTRQEVTLSNLGNFKECLRRLKVLMEMDLEISEDKNIVIETNIGCFWKNSSTL